MHRSLWKLKSLFKSYNLKWRRFYSVRKEKKLSNTDRALEYFDVSYPPIYGQRWRAIRLALLSKKKQAAIINAFGDQNETIEKFQNLGAFNLGDKYRSVCKDIIEMRYQYPGASLAMNTEAVVQKPTPEQLSARPSFQKLSDDERGQLLSNDSQGWFSTEHRDHGVLGGINLSESPRPGPESGSGRLIIPKEGLPTPTFQDYVPSSGLLGVEDWAEEMDVIEEIDIDNSDIGLSVIKEKKHLSWPLMLTVMGFPKGDITSCPQPSPASLLGVSSHYVLDAASLLPVLALDLQPGDRVLDLCAAPGGKTLAILQSALISLLVSNDVTLSRTRRIQDVLREFYPEDVDYIKECHRITQGDGCLSQDIASYDKVLVDAPCLTDRHSLHEDDSNIFGSHRVNERLRLPELQSALLASAVQSVRPGGYVVYSTCTLSPLQNDGVVHMALSHIWQKTAIQCAVVDYSYSLRPLLFLYKVGRNLGLRYGQIVLPSVLSNYGPMYCAKIKRLA